MTDEQAQELYDRGEIPITQLISIQTRNRQPHITPTNRGHSIEYWKRHFHHAILGEQRDSEDNSNVDWTRSIYAGLISGQVDEIFGLSGQNGIMAIMAFIKENDPNKYIIAVHTLKEYGNRDKTNRQFHINYADILLRDIDNL